MADCEARIQRARAAVFAADDGVVTASMTTLEREWRMLARTDRDAGLMDLWASIAPASWLDRKLWRDSPPAAQLDAAIALAADAEGVEAAEAAARDVRDAFLAWEIPVGERIRWRLGDRDVDATSDLLSEVLRAATATATEPSREAVRARSLEQAVRAALTARLPERPLLAGSIAHAAFVDRVLCARRHLHADRLRMDEERPSPAWALYGVWRTGHAIASIDDAGIVLAVT
ncbi:MAG: hypothetical protein JST00_45410 [Deltaproteobacteria bacterium]|nr:hypothetical protein [Deltaproteobacteria bacterium]